MENLTVVNAIIYNHFTPSSLSYWCHILQTKWPTVEETFSGHNVMGPQC